MKTNNRTRKLVLQVSEEAYQALQNEAVRIDRHAFNVASEICDSALLALNYKSPRENLEDEAQESEVSRG